MGGDYYDRDVISNVNADFSTVSSTKFTSKEIHPSLDPKKYCEEFLTCNTSNPIVFALDVTGSMGNWSKIIYDKLPMFYGQIMMKGYLENPSISFCAVGDYKYDSCPLQVSEFGQNKEIDQLISKIYLEGGGGNPFHESYELAAFFYLNCCNLNNSELPFFFFTGDELFYDQISKTTIENIIGVKSNTLDSYEVMKNLKEKYNVFILKKKYDGKEEKMITNTWMSVLGEERVLKIDHPKACIDIMLGAIALTSGKRTLEEYIKDMKERNQTSDRISEVIESLKLYSESVKNNTTKIVKSKKQMSEFQFIDNLPTYKKEKLKNDEIEKLEKLIKIKNQFPEEFSEFFICPLTKEPMIEPVLSQNGTTYDKYAITKWFELGMNYLPFENSYSSNKMIPNVQLKKMIEALLNKH